MTKIIFDGEEIEVGQDLEPGMMELDLITPEERQRALNKNEDTIRIDTDAINEALAQTKEVDYNAIQMNMENTAELSEVNPNGQ